MAQIDPNTQKKHLHTYIAQLVEKFGRDQFFKVADLYTTGGTQRRQVGAEIYLPTSAAIEHLKELETRGLVVLKKMGEEYEFRVTESYEGLRDRITSEDIYKEKLAFMDHELPIFSPMAYEKFSEAQQRLATARNETDFSEIGNLCIQFWEDFSDDLWTKLNLGSSKPAKKQIKDKLSPIFRSSIKDYRSQNFANTLWELFDQLRDLLEKIKHRRDDGAPVSTRDVQLGIILTTLVAEEIIYSVSGRKR